VKVIVGLVKVTVVSATRKMWSRRSDVTVTAPAALPADEAATQGQTVTSPALVHRLVRRNARNVSFHTHPKTRFKTTEG